MSSQHFFRRSRRLALNEAALTLLPRPDSISNLVYWVSANVGAFKDAAKTQYCQDGDKVAVWADQVAGLDFSQTTSANQPTFRTNQVNGYPAINFGSSAAIAMQNTHSAVAQPYTIITVFNPTNLTASFNLICDGTGNTPQVAWQGTSQTSAPYLFAGAQGFAAKGVTFNKFGYVVASFNTTSSYFRWSGEDIGMQLNPSNGSIQNTVLGNNANSGGVDPATGQMCEFLLYSRLLTIVEVVTVETYFINKYALTPGA